jgi:hypothetical protein
LAPPAGAARFLPSRRPGARSGPGGNQVAVLARSQAGEARGQAGEDALGFPPVWLCETSLSAK